VNCTNLSDLINNTAPYVIIGVIVLGFVIVAIIRALKGD
jgi:F0F1-type ATP synthase assembly protein I